LDVGDWSCVIDDGSNIHTQTVDTGQVVRRRILYPTAEKEPLVVEVRVHRIDLADDWRRRVRVCRCLCPAIGAIHAEECRSAQGLLVQTAYPWSGIGSRVIARPAAERVRTV